VNLAAGMALGGLKPVVAIYSTFLQRALDQIALEICLQNLPVVLAIDRAGLVGEDGSTHHGYFDVSYLRMLPNMTIMAPGSGVEMEPMLRLALRLGTPVAVRFPRGEAEYPAGVGNEVLVPGKGEVVRTGDDVAIMALGATVPMAMSVARILESEGIEATVVNARFAKPVEPGFIEEVGEGKRLLITLEDNVVSGGYGDTVTAVSNEKGLAPVLKKGLPDRYVEHGGIRQLREEVGLSDTIVAGEIIERLKKPR